MTTSALKKLFINRKAEINDVSFLNAIKTIPDTKTQTQTHSLTPEQRFEIIESRKEIESGLFVEQVELDKEFNKRLNGKLLVLELVLCQDKELNYNGSYFFKDQGKKHRHSRAMASIFNADIWKKNNISLSYLSGQSTRIILFMILNLYT
ncbi:MAG: hypothetical protein IPM42_00330 [Saprospiraceae bacterium]|nr:hypothetical protein [Saprospiraceae bacterium]